MQANKTDYFNCITSSKMKPDQTTPVLHTIARIPRNTELPREVLPISIKFTSTTKTTHIEQQDIARFYWMYQHPDIKNLFRVYVDRKHLKFSFPGAAAEEKRSKEKLAIEKRKAEEEFEKHLEIRNETRLVYEEYRATTPNKVL